MTLKPKNAADRVRERAQRRIRSEQALYDFIGNARTFRVQRVPGDNYHMRRGEKIIPTSTVNAWARSNLIQMTADDKKGRTYRRVT